MTMDSRLIDVAGAAGARFQIRVHHGGSGPDLLYLHGFAGLFGNDPFLTALTQHFRVHAPLLPGYEDSEGAEHLRDMLGVTLHAFDVAAALELERPLIIGHDMGGMIAAEMAAIAPAAVDRLALISPFGLWRDDCPVADIFATLPFELPELLLHDAARHGALLSSGGDLNDPEFLTDFLVGNARRLGMAGKLLFPIPDRGLSERLYRIRARTAIIWGQNDRLIDASYADEFAKGIDAANVVRIADAGHLVQYEQTSQAIAAVTALG
jgi:pimeloyl-ACP methyl ester carboxylesterase